MKTNRFSFTTPVILCGTLLEWYDFTIFAYLAWVFANLFFPQHDPVAGLLAIFAIYASGNIARALSAIWFGQMGDTQGRKHALVYSIALMGIPSILIAITPTYAVIGIAASVLLVFYRLMQGLAMGGEYQGNAIFLLEGTSQRQGLLGSAIVTMIGLGMLLASLVVTVVTAPSMPTYAWRFAFLGGGLVALLALYVRYQSTETAAFKLVKQQQQILTIPLLTLIKQKPKNLIIAIIISLGAAGFNYSMIFLPSYFMLIHVFSLHDATKLLTISLLIGQLLTPLAGWISDQRWLIIWRNFLPQRWQDSVDNKLALMLLGTVCTLLLAYPCYWIYNHGNKVAIIIANLVIGALSCLYLAPKNVLLTQLFPVNMRYTGFGLGHNIGLALGSIAPILIIYAIIQQHIIMAPAYYLIFSSVMAMSCLLILWRHKDNFLVH